MNFPDNPIHFRNSSIQESKRNGINTYRNGIEYLKNSRNLKNNNLM